MADNINELSDETLEGVVGGAYNMGLIKSIGLQVSTKGPGPALTVRYTDMSSKNVGGRIESSYSYTHRTGPAALLEHMINNGVTSCEIKRNDGSFYKANLADMKALCGMK